MEQIQVRNDTQLFRESDVLRIAQFRLLNNGRPLRILSFGCSIGDELVTLRLSFPTAEIVGCDINDRVLEIAQRTVGQVATIVKSDRKTLEDLGPYDLICAFAVLCKNPMPEDFLQQFPATRFDDMVGFLDSMLLPGGLLAITNSSYRFRDSPVFTGYNPIRSSSIWRCGGIHVMARDGQPFLIPFKGTFKKGPGFNVQEDEELTECLFEKRASAEFGPIWHPLPEPLPDFVSDIEHERSNSDYVGVLPHDAIDVYSRFQFGYDEESGRKGTALQRRWKSVVHDGWHIRPSLWAPRN